MKQEALLAVNDLHVQFAVRAAGSRPWHKAAALKAVNGVSFTLQAGETLGIVGESGCGKSTLARAIIGLAKVHSGSVLWQGQDLAALSSKALRLQRRDIQMIFQDPLASLNPRMTVGDIIAEPLRTFHPELKKADIMRQVQEIMQKVGLLPNQINRYPHEFSGGQCQRIGIAQPLRGDLTARGHRLASHGAQSVFARGIQQTGGNRGFSDIGIGTGDEIRGAHKGFSKTAYTT